MTEIPMWWLVLSGLFFLLALVATLGVLVMLIKIYPQLDVMAKTVAELRPQVNQLVGKVNDIAVTVDEVAKDTKQTMESVGAHAKNVAASTDQVTQIIAGGLARANPMIMGGITLFKLFQTFTQMRKDHPKKSAPQEPKPKPGRSQKSLPLDN